MGIASLSEIEPAYAQRQVDEIDARLAAIKDETKKLQDRRKALAPFVKK